MEQGACADLVLFDLSHVDFIPDTDPVNQLVTCADSASVTDVMVGGVFKVRDRKVISVDLTDLRGRVRDSVARLSDDDGRRHGRWPGSSSRMSSPLPNRCRTNRWRSSGASGRCGTNLMLTRQANSDLAELEQRVRFELDCLGYPARPWTIARTRNGTAVHDVIIVGGGQSGISIAFRLLRERITNLRVLDRNPEGRRRAVADIRPHAHAAHA